MMADIFEDFETYFTAQGLLDETPLQFDGFQTVPDKAVAIMEYEGASAPMQVTGTYRSFQLVVRDKSVLGARTRAHAFYRSLYVPMGILNLTEERWIQLVLKQPPFKLKIDEAGRTYYCFNFGANTFID
ncbi:hypothetical protein D3C81_323940 [compost metagenome]